MLAAGPVIGVHLRGTDAVSSAEARSHRRGSLVYRKYAVAIHGLMKQWPHCRIFAASDEEASIDFLRAEFGDRVIAYPSLRHVDGAAAGVGPTGMLMPGYLAADRTRAARSGEEAVIEYLLLARCVHLVHNGSGMARTVLLCSPHLPHTNTHPKPQPRWWQRRIAQVRSRLQRMSGRS